MLPVYNYWLVGLSILVAMLVSYTALRLAARVATSERNAARIWLGIGSIAMGVGIWSMHFIGMLAFSLPIPLAYNVQTTLASLAVAILTSGFALSITSGQRLTIPRLGGGALVMGFGIAAMHYMGMAAITVIPPIAYDPLLVAASVLVAVAASFVALWLFFRLREGNSLSLWLTRIAAALMMGLAISGMHYTGISVRLVTAWPNTRRRMSSEMLGPQCSACARSVSVSLADMRTATISDLLDSLRDTLSILRPATAAVRRGFRGGS